MMPQSKFDDAGIGSASTASTSTNSTTDSNINSNQQNQRNENGNENGTGGLIGHTLDAKHRLAFDQVGLIGREKEVRILRAAIQQQPKEASDASPPPSPQLPSPLRTKDGPTADDTSDTETSGHRDDAQYQSPKPSTTSPSSLRCAASTAPRTLVLVAGQSGSGKSAIIDHAKHQAMRTRSPPPSDIDAAGGEAGGTATTGTTPGILFVSGKCQLSSKNEGTPYAGIQRAMVELCEQIAASPSQTNAADHQGTPMKSDIQNSLLKNLSAAEIQLIGNVIPNIHAAVGADSLVDGTGDRVSSSASVTSHGSRSVSLFDANGATQFSVEYRKHTDRLKFILRRFIQILCSCRSIVVVVDDVQWADRASLDLIQTWLLDDKNTSLTIIAVYRSNMIDENQSFKATLASLEESKRERSIRIVRLAIDDFSVDQVTDYLTRLFFVSSQPPQLSQLSSPPPSPPPAERIQQLAEVVHKKTGGNPFFVQQYISSLHSNGLITQEHSHTPQPSSSKLQWTWNLNALTASSSVNTSTVIDLMTEKLRLIAAGDRILSIAACLGSTFSFGNICLVMKGLSIHSDHSKFFRQIFQASTYVSDADIAAMLESCCEAGLIQRVRDSSKGNDSDKDDQSTISDGNGGKHGKNNQYCNKKSTKKKKKAKIKTRQEFCFVHDKVQEAALALIPTQDQLSELNYRVGEILLYGMPASELETKVFLVANLLNKRQDLMPGHRKQDRRMKIVMLNHNAGMQAANSSAFHLAAQYFTTAIDLLPESHWETSFKQSLILYSSAAESCCVVCDFDRARSYCSIIMDQQCSILDKVRAYHVLIDVCMIETQKDHGVTPIDLCLEVLSKLGCNFPKSSLGRGVYLVRGMLTAKTMMKRLQRETDDALECCDDRYHATVMKCLEKLMGTAYLTAPDMVPLVIFKTLKRSLRDGITPHMATVVPFHGLILGSIMNDFEAGQACGQLALDILKLSDDQHTHSRTIFSVHSLVHHWKHPLRESLEPLREAYRIGMAAGDVEAAVWSLFSCLNISFLIGGSLRLLEAEHFESARVMLDFQQNVHYHMTMAGLQVIMNLRGNSSQTTRLIGDAYDERQIVVEQNHDMVTFHTVVVNLHKLVVASCFSDHERGAKMTVELAMHWLRTVPGSYGLIPMIFHGGLCCFAYARESKTRKYYRMGRKLLGKLKDWERHGCPNCRVGVALLGAEERFCRGQLKEAEKLYEESIRSARKMGNIHEEATANEKYSAYFADTGDDDKARLYRAEAIRLYKEWGADKKVELLLLLEKDR